MSESIEVGGRLVVVGTSDIAVTCRVAAISLVLCYCAINLHLQAALSLASVLLRLLTITSNILMAKHHQNNVNS